MHSAVTAGWRRRVAGRAADRQTHLAHRWAAWILPRRRAVRHWGHAVPTDVLPWVRIVSPLVVRMLACGICGLTAAVFLLWGTMFLLFRAHHLVFRGGCFQPTAACRCLRDCRYKVSKTVLMDTLEPQGVPAPLIHSAAGVLADIFGVCAQTCSFVPARFDSSLNPFGILLQTRYLSLPFHLSSVLQQCPSGCLVTSSCSGSSFKAFRVWYSTRTFGVPPAVVGCPSIAGW